MIVHSAFRRCSGRLLSVICTSSLSSVSRRVLIFGLKFSINILNNVEINGTVKIVFPFFCYRRTATKGAVEALIGSVKHYGGQVCCCSLLFPKLFSCDYDNSYKWFPNEGSSLNVKCNAIPVLSNIMSLFKSLIKQFVIRKFRFARPVNQGKKCNGRYWLVLSIWLGQNKEIKVRLYPSKLPTWISKNCSSMKIRHFDMFQTCFGPKILKFLES